MKLVFILHLLHILFLVIYYIKYIYIYIYKQKMPELDCQIPRARNSQCQFPLQIIQSATVTQSIQDTISPFNTTVQEIET